ncbi:hypothetical protein KP509_09G015000 [Ceratopteris richardii]|uniref:non-specific serine/threonine protein kinase n=1 Tax=Ceratopteris richardii TaxID=49495 RepID=A0A8T2U526_CERRI|nr:hypothetical protein KP509_09G015000 [Ceratopteris richardii]
MNKDMDSPEIRPTRIGHYELGRLLGEGTFAKVKFAKHMKSGKGVAIKILDKEKIFKDNLVDQIKREISVMKLVKHPNVVELFEIMASKSKIYFVLEYASGGELFNRIATKKRLKEAEARKYFQQLINAVEFCHSRGVYHRDLKPENLLLDSELNLKVSDFGLSALPQHLRQEDGLLHTTCGTPNYVAPEVIGHKGYDGAKADIWSCGVILFVLMAGYLPFDDSNLMYLYRKIHRADVRFPPWFSSGARKLITKILNPNPKLRMTIPQIKQDAWFQRDYKPPKAVEENGGNLEDVNAIFTITSISEEEHLISKIKDSKTSKPAFFNAFELISLSKGLNLSGLFEKQPKIKGELHFTSKHPVHEIILKMEETAKPLGFDVQRQDYKMRLHCAETGDTGPLSVATEVFEVAPSLYMVEVKKAGGDSLEYHRFYRNFARGLKDIVWTNELELDNELST